MNDYLRPITNVDFLVGTDLLARFTNAPYRLWTAFDFPGSQAFSVRATDGRGATTTVTSNIVFTALPLHVLNPCGTQGNGGFKVLMVGQAGKNYTLLAHTNLATTDWVPLGTMESTNGIWRFTDSAATNHPFRFYRARQQP